MLNFINQRLSIGLRLAIVGMLFCIFATAVCVISFKANQANIASLQKELRGSTYSKMIWLYVQTPDPVLQIADPKLLLGHEAYDIEFDTEKEIAALLSGKTNSSRRKAIGPLMTKLSNNSGIELDPNSDSYYIGFVYVKDLSIWLGAIDSVYQTAKLPPSQERAISLRSAIDRFKARKASVTSDYEAVFRYDKTGETRAALKAKYETMLSAAANIEIAAAKLSDGQDVDFLAFRKKFHDSYTDLVDATGQEFIRLVDKHVGEARMAMYVALGETLAFVLPSIFIIVLVTIGLTRRFTALDEAMGRLGQGDKTVEVPYLEDTNETGRIAATLERMKQDIIAREAAAKQHEEERIAAENSQKEAEIAAQRRGEKLVVSTFGEGLKALADERLSFRLEGEIPTAYLGLKDNFNQAISTFEQNKKDREEAVLQRERDRIAAETAQKKAEEEAQARSMHMVVSSFGEGLKALANRDLTFRMRYDLPEGYVQLQDDFNNALDQLQKAMTTIDSRASDIATGASEISDASQEMATRTERQAASLEETSAAMEEVTATAKKSALNIKDASSVAAGAHNKANSGNAVARSTYEAMQRIAKSSGEIVQIIGVIDEIAFQTNLLALNAGVEAARAGEAGKGFAVVASEVRALAQRSAEAAKQIKTLIKASEAEVESGGKLVSESTKALADIATDIDRINQMMREVSHAQNEQNSAMGEINSAVTTLDQSTQQNAAMAEEATAAARSMADNAKLLAGLIAQFRTRSDGSSHVAAA